VFIILLLLFIYLFIYYHRSLETESACERVQVQGYVYTVYSTRSSVVRTQVLSWNLRTSCTGPARRLWRSTVYYGWCYDGWGSDCYMRFRFTDNVAEGQRRPCVRPPNLHGWKRTIHSWSVNFSGLFTPNDPVPSISIQDPSNVVAFPAPVCLFQKRKSVTNGLQARMGHATRCLVRANLGSCILQAQESLFFFLTRPRVLAYHVSLVLNIYTNYMLKYRWDCPINLETRLPSAYTAHTPARLMVVQTGIRTMEHVFATSRTRAEASDPILWTRS
jgi:hypothetical protein